MWLRMSDNVVLLDKTNSLRVVTKNQNTSGPENRINAIEDAVKLHRADGHCRLR